MGALSGQGTYSRSHVHVPQALIQTPTQRSFPGLALAHAPGVLPSGLFHGLSLHPSSPPTLYPQCHLPQAKAGILRGFRCSSNDSVFKGPSQSASNPIQPLVLPIPTAAFILATGGFSLSPVTRQVLGLYSHPAPLLRPCRPLLYPGGTSAAQPAASPCGTLLQPGRLSCLPGRRGHCPHRLILSISTSRWAREDKDQKEDRMCLGHRADRDWSQLTFYLRGLCLGFSYLWKDHAGAGAGAPYLWRYALHVGAGHCPLPLEEPSRAAAAATPEPPGLLSLLQGSDPIHQASPLNSPLPLGLGQSPICQGPTQTARLGPGRSVHDQAAEAGCRVKIDRLQWGEIKQAVWEGNLGGMAVQEFGGEKCP